jgi:hypothetical protein
LEYHISVRYSIPASLARFGLLTLPLIFVLTIFISAILVSTILVSASHAQINGAPASVTSPGFGGRPVNGTAPSVTSLGPRGFAPNRGATFSTNVPRNGDGHHHHRQVEHTPPPVVYAVPVPYAYDAGATDNDNEDDANVDDSDANYQGGPTIFDRRGSGAASYVPPVQNVPKPHAVQDTEGAPADPEPPQAPTLLVFKDGHKLEVGNYAIVGATLFDLTPGHSRRVALADLDLEATRQQNDDRGVTFQLPPPPQAN